MHINTGDSYGLWACLRAYNDEFAGLVFRIHAEFVLEDGWFTPSQFAGHLVIDRVKESFAFFQMRVPGGPVNFDVNRSLHGMRIAGTGFCSTSRTSRRNTEDSGKCRIHRRDYPSSCGTCLDTPFL